MDRTVALASFVAAVAALTVIASLTAVAAPAFAGDTKPIVKESETKIKATIEAIDHDRRLITFKRDDGVTEIVKAGPEVRRFDELQVGDKVTFRATESVVYKIMKPGATSPASSTDDPAIVRGTGDKPGATITEQATAKVTVKSIDMKAPSVTVTTEDGRTMSYTIKDKGALKGLNPGDTIVIYYTVATAINVE